jgi:hypothetical protein
MNSVKIVEYLAMVSAVYFGVMFWEASKAIVYGRIAKAIVTKESRKTIVEYFDHARADQKAA